jgi:hypothetical protein
MADKQCQAILKSGPHKGKACGSKALKDSQFCGRHKPAPKEEVKPASFEKITKIFHRAVEKVEHKRTTSFSVTPWKAFTIVTASFCHNKQRHYWYLMLPDCELYYALVDGSTSGLISTEIHKEALKSEFFRYCIQCTVNQIPFPLSAPKFHPIFGISWNDFQSEIYECNSLRSREDMLNNNLLGGTSQFWGSSWQKMDRDRFFKVLDELKAKVGKCI